MCLINLNNHPLFNNEELEIPVYNSAGQGIPRHKALFNPDEPNCGILMDLSNIQALFTLQIHHNDLDGSFDLPDEAKYTTHVNVYPLTFLKSYGNLQATGIPYCFYKCISKINCSIHRLPHSSP